MIDQPKNKNRAARVIGDVGRSVLTLRYSGRPVGGSLRPHETTPAGEALGERLPVAGELGTLLGNKRHLMATLLHGSAVPGSVEVYERSASIARRELVSSVKGQIVRCPVRGERHQRAAVMGALTL